VFHDGKTVNYHTGQLTPKLRMLSYPITFWNICTQGQNTFHTHTHFEQLQHFILVLFDWLIWNLILLSSAMPQQLLECVSAAMHGISTCLAVSLWWAQLFCQFDNIIYSTWAN